MSETGRKVLIVDDEPGVRQIVSRALKKLPGLCLEMAESGTEALQKIQAGTYELVITDLKMPDMDGLTLCEKAKEEFPSLEFILLTGSPNIEIDQMVARSSVFSHISKPFKLNVLRSRVEEALEWLDRNESSAG